MPAETEYKGKHNITGISPRMEEVYDLIAKTAQSGNLVHILGESGTGKELVARAIHKESSCSNGPFIALNCGALSESVLESELFGHEKGAFTGAHERKRGYLEISHGGTLFLDEIAKVSKAIQVRLLRPLDGYEFFRVGGTQPIKTNPRIITASSSSLEGALASGSMTDEFYYRIAGLTIPIPPLRERGKDIDLLAHHYLEQQYNSYGISVKITEAANEYLRTLPWRGNVRELRRFMEAASVLKGKSSGEQKEITFEESDFRILYQKYWIAVGTASVTHNVQLRHSGAIFIDSSTLTPGQVMEQLERQAIISALEITKYDKDKAAELLGISIRTIYRRLEEWGMLQSYKEKSPLS